MKAISPLTQLRQRIGRLGSRDRRALTLGLWIVGPALGYAWVGKPVLQDFTAARERLEAERDLLRREQSLLGEAAGLPRGLSEANHRLGEAGRRLFVGSDPVSAAASLARHVADRAAHHRVMVQGSETQPAEIVADSLFRLSVELRAIGDLAGVTAWLADLESGPRLLEVTSLRITPGDRVGPDDGLDEEVLGVSLRISGYALGASPDSLATVASGSAR